MLEISKSHVINLEIDEILKEFGGEGLKHLGIIERYNMKVHTMKEMYRK